MKIVILHVKQEIKKYRIKGLQVVEVHIDSAFNNEKFEQAVKPAILHKYAANEYVGVAKRRNRTMKKG